MPKKDMMQQFYAQASAPVAPYASQDTKELRAIDNQGHEMIARIIVRLRAADVGEKGLAYLHGTGVDEMFKAAVHDTGVLQEAEDLPMFEDLVAFVVHSEKALMRNLLGLEDEVARQVWRELQREFAPAKKGFFG